MAEDALLCKQAAFRVFDLLDADDSSVEDNSQQAALNINLPLEGTDASDGATSTSSTRLASAEAKPSFPARVGSRKSNQQARPATLNNRHSEDGRNAGAKEFGPSRNLENPTSPARGRSFLTPEASRAAEVSRPMEPRRRHTEPHKPTNLRKTTPEVIVVGDSSSDDEVEIRTPVRRIPQANFGVPRRITGEKRKRNNEIPQLPEDQRCLKDCSIFFFPNNDYGMPRRIRMFKAVERGANWVKTWHSSVTHVVVDQGVTYNDLLKDLELPRLPDHVILVNDAYTTDCVRYRAKVDPAQFQYCVKGAPSPMLEQAAESPAKNKKTPEPEQASCRSLKIKQSKAQTNRQMQTTPGRSERSESDSDDESMVAKPSHAGKIDPPPTQAHGTVADDHAIDSQAPCHPPTLSDNDLNQAIAEAKTTAHLPLELDDDSPPTSRPTSSRSFEVPAWQNKFSCMQDPASRPSSSSGPNAHTIELLQQMGNYYDSVRDQWRSRAYRIAVSQLKKRRQEISTSEEAMKLPGIGSRLAEKIEEIHTTSRLRRLENALLEPEDKALKTFLGIYGVGFVLAQAWLRQGLRTLDDISKHDISLTKNQQIGLERYQDFNTRIPRDEVTKLGAVVIKALKRIDIAFEVMIGGSYRRGAETSGDIDMIITHPSNSLVYTRKIMLDTLVPRLEKQKFLVAGLAVTSREDGTKWHGACVLPATASATDKAQKEVHRPWRRIDLLLVRSDEMGAAVLYFTGNDIFNRSMRLLARKKGMRVNQRGLYKDVIRAQGGEKLNEGTKIAGRYERDIFEALGVPWRKCTERDC